MRPLVPAVQVCAPVGGDRPRGALHPRADDKRRPCAYPSDVSATEQQESPAYAARPQALAQARERQQAAARWLRPFAVAVIAFVVVNSLKQHPAPALSGEGAVVLTALVAIVGATVVLVRPAGSALRHVSALGAMIAGSVALVWAQSHGAGVISLFVVVGYAAMRSSVQGSLVTFALAAGGFAAAAAHAWHGPGGLLGAEVGITAWYLIGMFARRAREAQEQAERLLAELEASRRAQAEAGALRERSRLAREMHDVLAHSLSGLMLQLEGARMLAQRPDANGQLPAALERAHHLAHAGLEEARRAIGTLRGEDLPGPDRLEQLAADFRRDSSVQTTLEVTGTPRRLESETSLTLYRVAQEALTNSLKHAHPTRVELRLSYESQGTRLVVEDHTERTLDGPLAGHEHGDGGNGSGYGLTGMRERAELLGGRFNASPTSDGFRVDLWLPA
ncbi:MAG TPA: sensor histidine kinase [Solirubrobacteraceae bacterium]|nr:sensor histidine kinase [Solirubrobacteraceae bacterium]